MAETADVPGDPPNGEGALQVPRAVDLGRWIAEGSTLVLRDGREAVSVPVADLADRDAAWAALRRVGAMEWVRATDLRTLLRVALDIRGEPVRGDAAFGVRR